MISPVCRPQLNFRAHLSHVAWDYFKGFGTQELWRSSSNGGDELCVLDTLKLAAGAVVAGAAVNDGFYYIEEAKDEVALKFVDFATRHERRLAGLGQVAILPFAIAVSPDRQQILYSQTEQTGADIMLVENFH